MRRSKAELQKYIEGVQSNAASPREKSMKGFLFAKLYYEAKEYDLAKRNVSSYINVQERDPKAHRFLGHLFEIEGNVEKAIGCYKRSLELNPTQKDLVLKIAELICTMNVTDGRAEYWVERASKLFPGNPVIYKLKEQMLNSQGEVGWNRLFDLLQSELFARPNDVHLNIRLVELFRSDKRLEEAVVHCLKPERRALRTNLEWCTCVVQVLQEYLSSKPVSEKSSWRSMSRELLLAHADVVVLTLSNRDVQESKLALESFDQALLLVKPHVNGTDDLSVTFSEMRGHYYMHVGTQLLKMGQHSEQQWKALLEPAALCYLLAFQVPWNKPINGDEHLQNILEGLACDRQSQTGHLLLSLSLGKDDFLKDVTETFANPSGQTSLLKFVFDNQLSMENSFLGTDDIRNISCETPDLNELRRYDHGAVRAHDGNLQHLTWLGLQWHYMSSLPNLHKWLKQMFPRLPQETSRLETNTPESICILDLEAFLLGVVYTCHLQLQGNRNTSNVCHQLRCLPLPICKQLFTDKQKSWWDSVYSLIHKKAQPGTSAKLRLVIQHELNTLRALEKHGLQPAILIYWARSLFTIGSNLNSFYDQRDYMVRCIHYWKKVLPLLDLVKQKRSIPEPVDPLFKHFHSIDIKLSEVRDLEDEAGITFAKMDLMDGKNDDAILALEAIKSVASYWNLALVYRQRGEDIDNDILSSEEQEEHQICMQKCKSYLLKILNDVSVDPSLTDKLPVPVESVEEMLDDLRQSLGEVLEERSPNGRHTQSFMSASAIKHSTPSPSKFSISPGKTAKYSSRTPPPWAEDQKALIEELVQQVEALKKEVQELRMNNTVNTVTSNRWPADVFSSETATDGYHLTQSYYDAPLTVSTAPHSYYAQSPAYNPPQLLRPVTNVTPTKTTVYPVNRMTTQQHMYAMHTPPVPNTAICPPALRFESPATNILSPQADEFYNYTLPQNTANPALPEPGYFTKAALGPQTGRPDGSKMEFGKNNFVLVEQNEGPKPSQFTAPLQSNAGSTFKFNSNFKSNDGDFTFSSTQSGTPTSAGSECLLRLLTSDKPAQEPGKKPSNFENAADSSKMFRFGEKCILTNFNEGTKQAPDNISTFGQGDNVFNFHSSGKSTFASSAFTTESKEEQNESCESVPEEDGPHFEPVVPLPEKIEVKTGEEDEEEMFCNRAKLFRFDVDTKEWKERGLGNVKILKHRVSGKIRLLMRREQVLKICANHLISTEMKLKPLSGSDKSYVWHAHDYADEMPKPEQFAIRFKTADEALLFKIKFEEAQNLQKIADSSSVLLKHNKDKPKAEAKPTPELSFGSQFGLKQGEWQCEVCLAKNAGTSIACVCCESPYLNKCSKNVSTTIDTKQINSGASSQGMSPSSFTFSKDILNSKSAPGDHFKKVKEQWICSKCSAMNDSANKECVSCQHSSQINVKTVSGFKNVTDTQGGVFGSAFMKKAGQWDCETCCLRNEPSAIKCVACQATNPSNSLQATTSSASSFKFVAPESTSQKDFGSLFAKKEGQWDCSTCMVRNEASVSKCVSCETPQKTPSDNVIGFPVQPSSFSFSKTQNGSLESMFSRKEGQWDCTVCLVRNEGKATSCVACQAANPNANTIASTSETKPAITFGFKESSSEQFGPPSTGFKCNFAGKDFKFGTTDEKASFSFKAPSSSDDTKLKGGFNSAMSFSASSFTFGIAETDCKNGKDTSIPPTADSKEVFVAVDTGVKPEESKQKSTAEITLGQSSNSFSFADLAKTTEGFAFGKTDPGFKGFSRAGEKLFVARNKGDLLNTTGEQEVTEDLYRTEDRDDIHFEPIVQLPDKVELVTGEEDEKVLYSQRVKLFRFDTEISQWKERGVGMLKILKNEVNGKLRMLMRREQVFKVCANHWITTTMNLKPLSGSDRAWMWMASDFSDGDAKLEQLAAKFKTLEQAEDFKNKFEECQRLLLDIPLQTPHKLVDTGRTAQLIKKAEEMKSGLKDLKTFLTDQPKPEEDDTNTSNSVDQEKKTPDSTEPTFEWDTYDIRGGGLESNLDDSVYASPLSSSPEKSNLFRFGESTTGFNFSFQPVPSPAKSPTKLNQSRVSVGTDEESDVTQEEERDSQYFEPVVPLPDLVEVSSGEEHEQTLFCNRAKLYRFDKDNNQWKERGIGDLKILQNSDHKSARIVMRRDQVLKLCANHRITSDTHLEPMKGAEKAWVWTAYDFAEGEGKFECFAVRFKLQEVADLFRESFEAAKLEQTKDSVTPPVSSPTATPKSLPCGKAAVAILEETTKEKTDQSDLTSSVSQTDSDSPSPSDKASKTVVSPPKFVFGTDVVKNIFGTEKQGFSFGNTSGAGSLFGFSFNASRSSNKDEKQPPKLAPTQVEPSSSKDSSAAFQKPVQNPTVSTSTVSSTPTQQIVSKAKSSSDLEADGSPDVLIVYELTPTAEQRVWAEKLLLPPTFFCYKNKAGYVSDDNDLDDEDFESAVKKLNGQLYQEERQRGSSQATVSGKCHEPATEAEKECVIVWEKKPTPEEKAKAESLKLPPTFFCGVSSDTDEEQDNSDHSESAVRKVESEASKEAERKNSTAGATDSSPAKNEKPDRSSQEPVDLSSKAELLEPDSDSQVTNFSFGLSSGSALSFADLSSNNGEFAFGSKGTNFQWANTGAAVFSSVAQNRTTEKEGESDEELVHSEDVHFEPIVSLPEVEVKSGEEDEEILFKERTKLYRWDRDANQWKERGVGEIKILFHKERKYYRVLMRREQVLKVCTNHIISKDIKLAPLNTANNALVWIANDFSDGEGRIEQFAARFKTQELADSFQQKFEECQQNL